MKGDSTWEEFCLIHLVMVLEAILMSRQPHENLQCLYENLMSNNFYKMAVLKKILLYLHLYRFYCKNLRALHAAACARTTFLNFLYICLWNFSSCRLKIFLQMLALDFSCLPAIFLGISPWKIVGKYCGKSKASTVCKDIQWQAVKLTFFATWSICRNLKHGYSPKICY